MTSATPTLRLRSRPEGVGIARAFVVASARVLGVEPPTIEGLRLAVSELTTLLVTRGDESFEVGVADRHGRVTVEITPESAPPPVPAEIEAIIRHSLEGEADLSGESWLLSVGEES